MFSAGVRREVAGRLVVAGCVAAEEEADELLASAPDRATLLAFVARRESGEPLAWITGEVRFAGIPIRVDRGVYVPRGQTEELALRAAALLPDGGAAADICTGSGAVAAYLRSAAPSAALAATDIDRCAVACARRNGVAALVADLDRGLRSGSFDVVTAVTPYVPTDQMAFLPSDVLRYEPRLAIDGGQGGLGVLRRLVVGAARLLHSGGFLLTEIGGDQATRLAPVLAASGFVTITTWCDEEGDVRGLGAERR